MEILNGSVLRDVNSNNEVYLIDLETEIKATAHYAFTHIVLIRDELTPNDLKRSNGILISLKNKSDLDLSTIKKALEKIAVAERQISNKKVEFFLEDVKYVI